MAKEREGVSCLKKKKRGSRSWFKLDREKKLS